MKKEKDFKEEKPNKNRKKEGKEMPRVRGHYRRVPYSRRRIRVSGHRRIPRRRFVSRKTIRRFWS